MEKSDEAVRTYLVSVREPDALRDESAIEEIMGILGETKDPLERLVLQQRMLDEKTHDPSRYEDDFVTHAKQWASSMGITAAAFRAEGVSDQVLRRAGFELPRLGARSRRPERNGGRKRVTAGEIRAVIPRGTFTVRDVEFASGASTAVVRRVIHEEVAAGNVRVDGKDPSHVGPGRSPVRYVRP